MGRAPGESELSSDHSDPDPGLKLVKSLFVCCVHLPWLQQQTGLSCVCVGFSVDCGDWTGTELNLRMFFLKLFKPEFVFSDS